MVSFDPQIGAKLCQWDSLAIRVGFAVIMPPCVQARVLVES
jgi:hypothetical protein